VPASIFVHYGGYATGESFVDGLTPAIWVGAVVVGIAAVAALLIPGRVRSVEVLRPGLDETALAGRESCRGVAGNVEA
jgi:hypothetical protein